LICRASSAARRRRGRRWIGTGREEDLKGGFQTNGRLWIKSFISSLFNIFYFFYFLWNNCTKVYRVKKSGLFQKNSIKM
jgi:hypothetical protein